MNARAALLALLGLVVGCVDTELSLVVELQDAAVAIRDEGEGDVVRTDLTLFVRVGTYALSGDTFALPRAQVFVGDTLAAQINLDRPADFRGTLAPGESTTVAITGSVPVAAWPDARAVLCGAESAEGGRDLDSRVATRRPDRPARSADGHRGRGHLRHRLRLSVSGRSAEHFGRHGLVVLEGRGERPEWQRRETGEAPGRPADGSGRPRRGSTGGPGGARPGNRRRSPGAVEPCGGGRRGPSRRSPRRRGGGCRVGAGRGSSGGGPHRPPPSSS